MNDQNNINDRLSDALEREIEQALAVDPSPDFAVRLRARLAGATVPAPWWNTWNLLAAGATATAIVAAVAVFRPNEAVRPALPRAEMSRPTTAVVAIPESNPAAKISAKAAVRSKAQPKELDVLVDPREAEGFRSFLEAVDDGRVDLARLVELQTEAMELQPMEEITTTPILAFKPITIDALTPVVQEQEERGNP